MRISSVMAALGAAALFATAGAASATVYTDRAAFLAAVSGATTLDFEGLAPDFGEVGGDPTFAVGGVGFSDSRIVVVSRQEAGFQAGKAYGSAYMEWQGQLPAVMTITLAGPVTAVGFDFMTLFGNEGGFSFDVAGGPHAGVSGRTPSFFGITSDTAFSSLTISSSDNFPTIDNLTFGNVAQVDGGVPEPASWALMIGGFGMAGAALRRRRTAVAA